MTVYTSKTWPFVAEGDRNKMVDATSDTSSGIDIVTSTTHKEVSTELRPIR